MPEPKELRAFFSYAHHDARTDPDLVPTFTTVLENRVNARLTDVRFVIWCDEQKLKMGDRWNAKIELELRNSHLLIVLLTPRWIDSDYCRKEYTIFEEVEASRGVGDYVAPLLAREIAAKHLKGEKKCVYERIKSRQYKEVLVAKFLALSRDQRSGEIEKIADGIERMIDRLRVSAIPSSRKEITRQKNTFQETIEAGGLPRIAPKSGLSLSQTALIVQNLEKGARRRAARNFGLQTSFLTLGVFLLILVFSPLIAGDETRAIGALAAALLTSAGIFVGGVRMTEISDAEAWHIAGMAYRDSDVTDEQADQLDKFVFNKLGG